EVDLVRVRRKWRHRVVLPSRASRRHHVHVLHAQRERVLVVVEESDARERYAAGRVDRAQYLALVERDVGERVAALERVAAIRDDGANDARGTRGPSGARGAGTTASRAVRRQRAVARRFIAARVVLANQAGRALPTDADAPLRADE